LHLVVEASLVVHRNPLGHDDDQLKAALRAQNITMAAYRQDLKRQIMRYRVINIAVGSKVSSATPREPSRR
jgi:hypothetical protein